MLIAQVVAAVAVLCIVFVIGYALGQTTVLRALDLEAERERHIFRVRRRQELAEVAQEFYGGDQTIYPGQRPDEDSWLDECAQVLEVEALAAGCDDDDDEAQTGTKRVQGGRQKRGGVHIHVKLHR